MQMARLSSATVLAACLLLLAPAPLLISQQPAAAPPPSASSPTTPSQPAPAAPMKPLLAEDVYQHVEIFKGKPAGTVLIAMNALRGLLGVDCTHCHTQYDWANESKPAKLKARQHFQMIRFINHNYFADKNAASCWTCHRGQAVPAAFQRDPAAIARATKLMNIPPDAADKPAEQVFKNIRTFKGVPAGRLPVVMTLFTTSLGVDCKHCHAGDSYASDDKPEKEKARQMLTVVSKGILREFYGGNGPVTCYSCHQGHVKPEIEIESGKPTEAVFSPLS
jgi:hypothetical protein